MDGKIPPVPEKGVKKDENEKVEKKASEEKVKNTETEVKTKKPFYKNWKVIVVIVIVLALIGSCSNSKTSNTTSSTSSTETTEEETEEKTEKTTKTEDYGEIESISASYFGSTEAGTVIDNNSTGIRVTGHYSKGKSKTILGWTVSEPVTLQASQTSQVTIQYAGQTTVIDVTCTTEDPNVYKSQCESIPYDELARNGDSYIGRNITFRGQILQVSEGNGFTVYRIGVTQDSWGYWSDDVVYCEYTVEDGQSRFLEDDIVTFWGVCYGLYTYKTVMGASVTIPSCDIKYIELS